MFFTQVYADDLLCGKVKYMPGQEVYAINCGSDTSENVFATNVLIKAAPKQYLALCEVNANYGYSLIFYLSVSLQFYGTYHLKT